MTWCLTNSGIKFDMANPQADQICIEDIANALSKQCRFNGHCTSFYSVAQHSVLVASLVDQEHKLQALLRDATEAYIGDMVSPLKGLMPEFKKYEQMLWHIIADKFGVPRELHPQVKHADLVMLATEKRDLMPHHPDQWPCLENINCAEFEITPERWEHAENDFINTFKHLAGEQVFCKNCDGTFPFGEYKNQVTLEVPKPIYPYIGQHIISVDKCCAEQIKRLWENGVPTFGCCCGHGRKVGFINVGHGHYEKALSLGFEGYVFPKILGGPQRKDTVKMRLS